MTHSSQRQTFSIAFLTGSNKSELLRELLVKGERITQIILPFSSNREEQLLPVVAIGKLYDVPVLRPKRARLESVLQQGTPDVLISAGYPYLLNSGQLSVAKFNINVHPTLLPCFRGPATAWHVIAHGATESGVTVHYIDEGMDTGDILAQVSFPLTPFDTVLSLMRKTAELEYPVLEKALARLYSGDIVGTAQDEKVASKFLDIRTPEDSRIDPSRPFSELYDFIRACDPKRFPAFFEVAGEKVGICLFRLDRKSSEQDMV